MASFPRDIAETRTSVGQSRSSTTRHDNLKRYPL